MTTIIPFRYLLPLVAVLLALAACAEAEPGTDTLSQSLPELRRIRAETSLNERIALADVIARVRLRSVEAGSIRLQHPGRTEVLWGGTLEHRFGVLEYLKGTGPATEITGVVLHANNYHGSAALALAEGGNALLAARDSRWDGREAVVFLLNSTYRLSPMESPDLPQAGRYILGSLALEWEGRPYRLDGYSIASPGNRRWLPSASSGATGASGEQRYLLAEPPAGASGAAGTTPTVTLTNLKADIAAIEAEATAGGGSDAYRLCLYEKYRMQREVDNYDGPGEYLYLRYDESIGSGLPAGTFVHSDYQLPRRTLDQIDAGWGEYRVTGRDHALFVADPRLEVLTARPLPAGEYRFNPYGVFHTHAACDAMPEEMKKAVEVFVTVTASAGTVHEAFFDPATIGTAVGADGTNGTNGVLKPTAFSVGGVSTALQSLKWESGTLTLELSSAASLTGNALDFIALDGSVALSLDGGAATVSGGTLTWSVADQPWQAGDLLMLRIRSGAPVATPTPTATPVPPAPPVFGSSTYAFSVAENAATGTAVGTVAATDANDDTVTYSVTAGNGDGAFAIDSASGAITVAGSLDRETTASYTLTVQAADGNGGTGTATVTVTVTKANEAPVFGSDSYSFSASETASAYSVVGTVAATDGDGDAVTYWITAGNGPGTFSIDLNEGFVLIRKALDYETTSSYTLTVEARDGNGGVDSATVTITVTDVEGS